jgi:hypothetical protein
LAAARKYYLEVVKPRQHARKTEPPEGVDPGRVILAGITNNITPSSISVELSSKPVRANVAEDVSSSVDNYHSQSIDDGENDQAISSGTVVEEQSQDASDTERMAVDDTGSENSDSTAEPVSLHDDTDGEEEEEESSEEEGQFVDEHMRWFTGTEVSCVWKSHLQFPILTLIAGTQS